MLCDLKDRYTTFGLLEPGDVFVHGAAPFTCVFMRIESVERRNAIRLFDGNSQQVFNYGEQVYKVKGKFVEDK